ncbi:MAG: hypothetical protein JWN60_2567 [Acidobacteria bacterium]|jgi:predicted nuclease of predicted toxin-antitoxin system|nr:hypothetical protein [Acidobacteriota bacterium]
MKLLFDHNLSPKLVDRLADLFPDSNHVFLLSLDQAEDIKVFDFAKINEYVIVTKDSDFNDLCMSRGFPPKIIWIRRGNCSVEEIDLILRKQFETLVNFNNDKTHGVLMLY